MTREEMRYKLNELRMMLNDGEHGEEQGVLVEIISELDRWEEIPIIPISALSENKRNTAEWEIDGHHLKCPICGEYFCRLDAEQCIIPCNFCPNCGAKMESGEDKE